MRAHVATGPNACRNFLAAGDEYKIAAALSTKPSDRVCQFSSWMDARRAYGWAEAYCQKAGDKDRADDGIEEAREKTSIDLFR